MQLPAEMLLVRCPDAELFERRSRVIYLGPSTLMALTFCSALMQTSIYHNHFLKLVVDSIDLPRIKHGTSCILFETWPNHCWSMLSDLSSIEAHCD